MRLRRGDCAAVGGRHARSTDSRDGGAGSDDLRRPHVASGLPPMIPRGSRALRCGRRRSSHDPPGRSLVSRSARSKSCHASCGPPPGESKSIRCSASEDFRGGFALVELDGAASLALAPAQLARGLERREKGIPLLLGGGRLCCADAGSASGTFRAAWP
jgi:hypothetical protein